MNPLCFCWRETTEQRGWSKSSYLCKEVFLCLLKIRWWTSLSVLSEIEILHPDESSALWQPHVSAVLHLWICCSLCTFSVQFAISLKEFSVEVSLFWRICSQHTWQLLYQTILTQIYKCRYHEPQQVYLYLLIFSDQGIYQDMLFLRNIDLWIYLVLIASLSWCNI